MTLGVETAAQPPISKAALRAQVLRFLDEEPGDEDNLMDFGLNSIAAMQLVAEWKAAALDVNFVELARCPTLATLWALIETKARSRGAIPGPAGRVIDA